jgi:cysteine desulfurase
VIGAAPEEIIWTSGATESDNLAIKGVAVAPAYVAKGNHVITCGTEHRAVLDPCEHLEGRGIKVTYLGVDRHGMIDLQKLSDLITPKTFLVSLMHANNETGVLHSDRRDRRDLPGRRASCSTPTRRRPTGRR